MPRMGQGPWQRGQLCVRLSPIHGPCRGSPPRNYSIRHKIIEQGRSLPAPFPATLPEPSPCHCPRNPPGTGPTASTAASSPSHSGTNSCPQLLQPRQSLSPCVAPCPGSPLIPAHSTSPQEQPEPPRLISEGLGSDEPMPGLAAHSPQPGAGPLAATLPVMTARGPPTMLSQARRWTNPVVPCLQAPKGGGQWAECARAACLGGTGRAVGRGRLPAPHRALPAGKGEGKGGMWEVLGTKERHRCLPRRHMLQRPLCVPSGWVEAMVNSTATILQMVSRHCRCCHRLGDLGGTGWWGGSTPGYAFSLGPQKPGLVLLGIMGLWDVATNVAESQIRLVHS